MNLHDYFAEQRKRQLSDQEKLAIYNKFLSKRVASTRPSFTKRMYSFRYAFSAIFVFVLAFGGYYSLQPNLVADIFFSRDSVQAVNVAQIIQAQGLYTIQSADNRKIVGTDIHDGDVIGVEEGSFVEVKISESHKAKIPGPASFQVVYAGAQTDGIDEYRLKMLDSNYVAIESIELNETFSTKPKPKKQENLVLVTDDGFVINDTKTKKSVNKEDTVSQETKTRFVVQKKEGKSLIDNAGTADIIVTHEEKDDAVVIIPDKAVASVDATQETSDSIQAIVADTIQELEELEQTISSGTVQTGVVSTGVVISGAFMTGSQFSGVVTTGSTGTGVVMTGVTVQTGSSQNDGTQDDSETKEPVENIEEAQDNNTDLQQDNSLEVDDTDNLEFEATTESSVESVSTDQETTDTLDTPEVEAVGGLNTDDSMLDEDQLYEVQQQLNGSLLMGHIEKLAVAYLSAESPKVTTQRSNIMARLNATYEIINIDNPYTNNTSTDIVNASEKLKNYLQKHNVSAAYTHNLDALISWIKVIYTFESGLYKEPSDDLNFAVIDEKLGLSNKAQVSFK